MLSARESIAVLIDPEALKLLFATLFGRWMIATATPTAVGAGEPGIVPALAELAASGSVVAGYVVYYGAALALLVKLVYEATVLADSHYRDPSAG